MKPFIILLTLLSLLTLTAVSVPVPHNPPKSGSLVTALLELFMQTFAVTFLVAFWSLYLVPSTAYRYAETGRAQGTYEIARARGAGSFSTAETVVDGL